MYNYVGLESYKQKNSSYHELQPINEVSLHILHIPSLDAYYLPRFNEWMNEPASCFARSVALSTSDKCTVIFYFSWILFEPHAAPLKLHLQW